MISLYDTTLRDGEQREGLTLTVEDKLRVARRLDALGITYIEGGFPGSNPKDDEFFARVGQLGLTHSRIAAFGTVRHEGIDAFEDAGLRALIASKAPVVTLVAKAWDIQVTQAVRTTLDENLRMVEDSIRFLLGAGVDKVFLDAEHLFDGMLANEDYALSVLRAGVQAGADTLVLCDTNGGMLPNQVFSVVSRVAREFPGVNLAIHAHNDCGCGVANSLEAVRAGAMQVQGTVNGYGERVGNADLTVVIPNLELKMGIPVVGPERLQRLTSTANGIAELLNVPLDSHHPYVGSSAFTHKGGLHASAIARLPQAYEHVDPTKVGNLSHVVVSELSGRASLLAKARELDIPLEGDEALATKVLTSVKELENKGYSFEMADASLALLVRETQGEPVRHFRLESFRVIADKREDGRVMTEATIKVHVGDERFIATGEGNGPVNALDNALRMAITRFYPAIEAIELTDYKVRVLDESLGTDAVTRVLIESSDGNESWGTVGVSENIIEASWDALVDAIEYGLLLMGDKAQS